MLPSDKKPDAMDTRTLSSIAVADADFSQQIVAASPVGITIYDQDGQCIMVNAAAADIVGTTQESLLAQNFHALRSWQESGLIVLAKEALNSDKPCRKTYYMTTTFGKEVWIDCQFTRIKIKGSFQLLAMFSDVTQFQIALSSVSKAHYRSSIIANDLINSERFIRAIADNMPGVIGYFDAHLICRFANRSLQQWFGVSAIEIVGQSLGALLGEKSFKAIEQKVTSVLFGKKESFEGKFNKSSDGLEISVWVDFIPDIKDNTEVDGLFASVTDISNLANSESRIIAEHSQDAFLVTGASPSDEIGGHKILYANAALEQQSGYSRDELIGRTPRILNALDGDNLEIERIKKAVCAKRPVKARIKNKRKSGETYWVHAYPVDTYTH